MPRYLTPHLAHLAALAAFATFGSQARLTAQDWAQVLVPTPTPTHATSMAFDAARSRMVLFGGIEADTGAWPPPAPLAETWEFTNGAWAQRAPANSPPARSQHVMVYDDYLDMVVVFGGIDANGSPLNDVWWFDGADWNTQYYPSAPPARAGAAAQYDGVLIIAGGWSPALGMLGDAWRWDRQFGWTQMTPAITPRRDAAIATVWTNQTYNGNWAQRVMLHGGVDAQGNVLSDCYLMNTTSWSPAFAGTGAPARSGHKLVYDHPSRSTLLVGGVDASGTPPATSELWRFDGELWNELPTATRPPSAFGAAVAIDPGRRRLVVVGGATDAGASQLNDEHWEFAPGPSNGTFGAGCSAFSLTATLYTGLCARGKDWEGSVGFSNSNVSWALFAFGLSNTSWNGTPLPFNLGPIGNPVCDLLVEPAVTLWQPTSPGLFGGAADFSLPIPNVPSAYGINIYAQALGGNNASIVVTSPGVQAMVW